MNCEEAEVLLLDYVDSRLDGEEPALLEEHISSCWECKIKLHETRDLVDALRAADAATTPLSGAAPPPPLQPPAALLGDFEILEKIGQGGMGVVYKARQVSLERLVALKLLPDRGPLRSANAVSRFLTEAQAAARLHHPNIVPIFAQGQQDGHFYYAMELIEGRPLSEVIEERRRSGSAARPDYRAMAAALAEVCEALHYAHGRGVIHRDIKPQNLLVRPGGQLMIADFGLARALEEPNVTVTGEMLGTPAYMSPEQVSGDSTLDGRTDVYSLGVTLYEMLVLHRPFEGRTREQIIAQIATTEPPPPRRIDARVPADLETICLRAMEKNPARRFPTAGAMAADLRRYLNDLPITSRRTGAALKATKWMRRHPTLVAALAVGVTAAAMSFGIHVERRNTNRADQLLEPILPRLLVEDYQVSVEADLAQVARWGPSDPGLLDLTRAISQMAKDPASAESLELLQRVHAAEPDNVTVLNALAWAHRRRGEFGELRAALQRADQIRPASGATEWFLRGLALHFVPGHALAAMEAFEQARRANDPLYHPLATQNIGRAINFWMFHARAGADAAQFTELYSVAVARLEALVEMSADADKQIYALYLLSIAHRLAGDFYAELDPELSAAGYQQAQACAERAQGLITSPVDRPGPRDALAYIVEGELHEAQGDYRAALAAYDQAEQRHTPQNLPSILEYRWRLHFWLGDTDRALLDLERWSSIVHPEVLRVLWLNSLLRAVVLEDLGDHAAAVQAAMHPAEVLPQVGPAVLAAAAGLTLIREDRVADELLASHLSGIDWAQRGLHYQEASWNRLVYDFVLGDAALAELEALAGELAAAEASDLSPADPSWRMAEAWFFEAVRQLRDGRSQAARDLLSRCVKTCDNQFYSYVAETLLRRMEQDDGWPDWLLAGRQ